MKELNALLPKDFDNLFMDHVTLGNLLPFYCCWLDDGEGKPIPASVTLGPCFFAVNPWKLSQKAWKN